MALSGISYGSLPGSPTPASVGSVPRPINLPNPFADLSGVYPNLSGTNAAASSDLMSQFMGQVSPGTQRTLQDAAASWGSSMGQPGFAPGTLPFNRGLRDLGLTSEELQQQAFGNYASLLPTISRTQTVSPELQTQVAETNAVNAAAPQPVAAATYAQQLFDKYLKSMSSPAGGTGARSDSTPWWQQGNTNWGSGGSGAEWDRWGGIPGII